MLAIKLKRIGKKHQASFRLVVMEKRSKLQGRFIEDLGWANPRTDERQVDAERASYWLKVGAQPTNTAWNLLVKAGVAKGKKIAVHGKSKKTTADGGVPQEAVKAVAPAPEQKSEAVVESQPEKVPPAA
ncbi:MAG: 30S ribosomal protein S16 [Candidatus Jorgensenbacteria bacterium]|nr:30S ribosomal protein S16 [Candidatus Jorgensenbacteria bacterium]